MSGVGDAEAHAAALAGLAGMTPVRLAKILAGLRPVIAWQAVRAGTHPADPGRRFAIDARKTDVGEVATRYERAAVKILLPGIDGYPSMLTGDPGAPAVLFAKGDPAVLEGRPRVSIVGTRSATHYGRRVASELAGALATQGVVVVSGLALGIDGAAHSGVVHAPTDDVAAPVAVVGTGLDIVYPASNGDLWARVAERGAVVSESALGTKPHPRVFPARNRIIAALSDVVVVVECHRGGGSLYTAEAAARRSIPVCAVPGSVHSRASDGTNSLLVDGCTPVRDAADVLVAISLARADRSMPVPLPEVSKPCRDGDRGARRFGTERSLADLDVAWGASSGPLSTMTITQRSVWEAVDETPTAFETILIRTDLSIARVAEACEQLVAGGALLSGAGWWSRE